MRPNFLVTLTILVFIALLPGCTALQDGTLSGILETIEGSSEVFWSAITQMSVARLYSRTLGIYGNIPLAEKPQMVDLENFVNDRALSTLFTILGQEEQKIRSDPVARTTDLLRRVFGPK